jgi:hypothetical protein
MRIAIATFSARPAEFDDDERLGDELAARGASVDHRAWEDPDVDWDPYDAVIIRSTWDYAYRREEFVGWAERVGDRLHNSPAVVRWNSDKRYLGDLAGAGFAVVPTRYVEPGDPVPELEGELVVKPNVSGGARDTGRFSPATHDAARELIGAIQAQGKVAMVQPYVASVDSAGETAIVCFDGEPAYTLRKGAVLRPDEVAPLRDDALAAAEVMYDPELVLPDHATDAELGLARRILGHVAERFDYMPLYARVDLIAGTGGEPTLIELEAIEPNFYLSQVEGSAAAAADAFMRRLGG